MIAMGLVAITVYTSALFASVISTSIDVGAARTENSKELPLSSKCLTSEDRLLLLATKEFGVKFTPMPIPRGMTFGHSCAFIEATLVKEESGDWNPSYRVVRSHPERIMDREALRSVARDNPAAHLKNDTRQIVSLYVLFEIEFGVMADGRFHEESYAWPQ